jgi:light-harvesting protein B-800-850 alpha chain
MIYGKIWLVVKPSVGVPLFLGAVAVSSFAVHYALLTHTTWLPKFLEGGAAKATVQKAAAAADTAVLTAKLTPQK